MSAENFSLRSQKESFSWNLASVILMKRKRKDSLQRLKWQISFFNEPYLAPVNTRLEAIIESYIKYNWRSHMDRIASECTIIPEFTIYSSTHEQNWCKGQAINLANCFINETLSREVFLQLFSSLSSKYSLENPIEVFSFFSKCQTLKDFYRAYYRERNRMNLNL